MAYGIAGLTGRLLSFATMAAIPRISIEHLKTESYPTSLASWRWALARSPNASFRASPAPTTCRSSPAARPRSTGYPGTSISNRRRERRSSMTGPELMRSTTILAEFSRNGAKVASITAKDKLRQQLGKDMNIAGGCINFPSEKADKCNKHENGIENVPELVGMPLPDMYSPELSLFVLEAGIKLLETEKPLIMYLSLTDYIQHKYVPGEPEADRYYRDMDALFGRLHELGAVVGLVADHGMRDKCNPDGSLKVVWLQDALDLEFGKGATTVICPITDYFVAHH